MCGIVGILKNSARDIPSTIVEKMTADVSHRGPDDEGVVFLSATSSGDWQPCSIVDEQWSVALGSRRLKILDLTDAGHMPMVYRDKYWIVYNGEIYNFIEIRTELEQLGYTFRSSSDTEVILAAYHEWGTASFARFRGMWGLVIFDCIRNEAVLSRDRLGIKPLYVWQEPGAVAIVSEIKQFLHMPGFTARVNRFTAAEYLRTGYQDPSNSFFHDVQVVPPGCWLKVPLSTLVPSTPQEYWHPERVQVSVWDADEAGRLFADKLRESVRIHLRSDVPVGCALSGGMDSSSIAMLVDELKGEHDPSLHTFSCIFPGDPLDEREYIDAVVSSIRAVPHVVIPQPELLRAELKHFVRAHDEPVGSFSVYASYCIARLTREAGIPVTLNGQGGDEILSGYWYCYFHHLRELAKQGHLLQLMGHFAGALRKNGNPTLLAQAPGVLRRYNVRSKPSSLVRLRDPLVTGATTVLEKMLTLGEQAWRVEQIRSMSLPRLLKWDDRNSMAFSVEGRYPFLDHELIELCLSFAPSTLQHSGWTKWPLRLGLRRSLPKKILYRRTKLGFAIPQEKWLCGPFRPELENWLKQDRPLWAYIERADARNLANRVWQLNGKWDESSEVLFRLFIFDQWAEVFGVAE